MMNDAESLREYIENLDEYIENLKRKYDEEVERGDRLAEELCDLRKERDTLEAHIERLLLRIEDLEVDYVAAAHAAEFWRNVLIWPPSSSPSSS